MNNNQANNGDISPDRSISVDQVSADRATLPGGIELSGNVSIEGVEIITPGTAIGLDRAPDPDPLETTRCDTCRTEFNYRDAPSQFDGDRALYRCPECNNWSYGPPPDHDPGANGSAPGSG